MKWWEYPICMAAGALAGLAVLAFAWWTGITFGIL